MINNPTKQINIVVQQSRVSSPRLAFRYLSPHRTVGCKVREVHYLYLLITVNYSAWLIIVYYEECRKAADFYLARFGEFWRGVYIHDNPSIVKTPVVDMGRPRINIIAVINNEIFICNLGEIVFKIVLLKEEIFNWQVCLWQVTLYFFTANTIWNILQI